jgi:phosphatidylglycerophosphatase A
MPERLSVPSLPSGDGAAPIRPSARFLLAHPAHFIALGCGSGLSPLAPGTAGTLWAWLAFLVLQLWLTPLQLAALVLASIPLGWWASSVTARDMRVRDPGQIVWDEVAAFWLVLWLVLPASPWEQLAAFALFRFFDAVKPGPVAWADALFHGADASRERYAWHTAGLGIMLDDLVAAFCTLLVIALWRFW